MEAAVLSHSCGAKVCRITSALMAKAVVVRASPSQPRIRKKASAPAVVFSGSGSMKSTGWAS